MPESQLRWSGRMQTLRAMALIIRAQFLIRFVPMTRWHKSLGEVIDPATCHANIGVSMDRARNHAARVKRAASRFFSEPKCLAQAMALQWLLIRERIPSRLVIAMEKEGLETGDAFHAWIELNGEMLIGACAPMRYRTLLTFGR
jgi:hypothetical protein